LGQPMQVQWPRWPTPSRRSIVSSFISKLFEVNECYMNTSAHFSRPRKKLALSCEEPVMTRAQIKSEGI